MTSGRGRPLGASRAIIGGVIKRLLLPGAAALALAACGSPAHSTVTVTAPARASSPAAHPANPVTVVRETGATAAPGEEYGSTTAQGWLSADGSYLGTGTDGATERVDVYTLPPGLTGAQAITQLGVTSSDSQVLIAGSDFYLFVYPAQDMTTGVGTYPVSPSVIATRVHGQVVAPD